MISAGIWRFGLVGGRTELEGSRTVIAKDGLDTQGTMESCIRNVSSRETNSRNHVPRLGDGLFDGLASWYHARLTADGYSWSLGVS